MAKSCLSRIILVAAIVCALLTTLNDVCIASNGVFGVRDYGAAGDGKKIDTVAINKAVKACAEAGGGQVRFNPGIYISGTIDLKDNVTLFFEASAALVGTARLDDYQYFVPPANTPEARFGKWHSELILGVDLKNVTIAGPGVIDGNKVFNPRGEQKMRGPHSIILPTAATSLSRTRQTTPSWSTISPSAV